MEKSGKRSRIRSVSSTGRLVKGAGEGEELSAILGRARLGGLGETAPRLTAIEIERKIVRNELVFRYAVNNRRRQT
jgi:hypothetical protein